jgi:hypothetical protein
MKCEEDNHFFFSPPLRNVKNPGETSEISDTFFSLPVFVSGNETIGVAERSGDEASKGWKTNISTKGEDEEEDETNGEEGTRTQMRRWLFVCTI